MKLQEAEAQGDRLDAPDVIVSNHGSVVMFTPLTEAAREWVNNNVGLESWQWLGRGFAVEPRYAGTLAEGMMNDGLEVQ